MLSGEQDVLLNALLSDSVVVGNVFFCVNILRERERAKEKHKHSDRHRFSVCSVNLSISIISNGSDIYIYIYIYIYTHTHTHSHMYIYSILIKSLFIEYVLDEHLLCHLQNWLVIV